ncbi:hypothetical protein [Neisseria yangbaofengii]|uniref:hypothetical protein n=1 Tax=Neisseria yangbaofengii TaxID=2709396 RepID=UPI0013E9B40F|nr:hypothetical protein [Neisseria yangbaofengii]
MLRPSIRLCVRAVYAEMGAGGSVDAVRWRKSVISKLHQALAHLPPVWIGSD